MKITEKIFGTHSQRELKRITPIVDKIEALRPTMQAMSDTELRDQTRKFRERLEAGETLDDLLPEAFATVREAGSTPCAWHGTLPRTAHWRCDPASGKNSRDAYR